MLKPPFQSSLISSFDSRQWLLIRVWIIFTKCRTLFDSFFTCLQALFLSQSQPHKVQPTHNLHESPSLVIKSGFWSRPRTSVVGFATWWSAVRTWESWVAQRPWGGADGEMDVNNETWCKRVSTRVKVLRSFDYGRVFFKIPNSGWFLPFWLFQVYSRSTQSISFDAAGGPGRGAAKWKCLQATLAFDSFGSFFCRPANTRI